MPADWPFTVTPTSVEGVAHAARGHLGDHHREQRDRPEDRAAVDDDQEEEHERGRGEQQGAVDRLEHLDRVRGEAGGAGGGHLEAAVAVAHGRAYLVHAVEQEVGVAASLDRHGEQGGLAVARRHHGGDPLRALRRVRRHLRPVAPHPRAVRRGEAGLAPVDHHGGGDLARREPLRLLEHLDRLGAAGQEARRVVLLRFLELAGE